MQPLTESLQALVVGTYQIAAFTIQTNDEPPVAPFGEHPRGYLVVTPQLFTATFSANNRKPGTSAEAKAALQDSMVAYSGKYKIDNERISVAVDISWSEHWIGTDQVRFWKIEQDYLILTTEPTVDPRDEGKKVIAKLVWKKVE